MFIFVINPSFLIYISTYKMTFKICLSFVD